MKEQTNKLNPTCLLLFRAVDGVWSAWKPWGDCPVTCGTGMHTRERSCDNPAPAYGGDACQGPDTDQRVCADWDCPGKKPYRAVTMLGQQSLSSLS